MGNTNTIINTGSTFAATKDMYDIYSRGVKIDFNFVTISGAIYFSFYDTVNKDSAGNPISYSYNKIPYYVVLNQDSWSIMNKITGSVFSDTYDGLVGHKLTIYADTQNISYFIDNIYFYSHPYNAWEEINGNIQAIKYGFLFEFKGLTSNIYNTNITNFSGEFLESTVTVQSIIDNIYLNL